MGKQITNIGMALGLLLLWACSNKPVPLSPGLQKHKLNAAYSYSYKRIQVAFLSDTVFKLPGTSTDKHYGYSPKSPIMVGGADVGKGVLFETYYLNALMGPYGELVTWQRIGTCCPFSTPNGIIENTGLLDIYELNYIGQAAPVRIYINMYDYGKLLAPYGFSYAFK